MNALEEGTAAQIDFEKIGKAARSTEGLVPVVLQDADSLEILVVGYANDLALDEALRSGHAVLWSASRDELCHTETVDGTSRRTCFYRRQVDGTTLEFIDGFEPSA